MSYRLDDPQIPVNSNHENPKLEGILNDKNQKKCRVTGVKERGISPRHPTLDPRYFRLSNFEFGLLNILQSWLGDQESNLDSQIQNLMSYQLDDPQNKRAPAGQCLLGLFIQKADHSLPSTMGRRATCSVAG
jgi:hypothetical protein